MRHKADFLKTMRQWTLSEASDLHALLLCATLCNDAEIQHDEAGIWRLVGDPTEGALQTLAAKAEMDCAI
jgi:magnesium-transporting ATPase (P-type)